MVKELWVDVKEEPEAYEGQQIAILLERKIESFIQNRVQQYADKWCMDEATLRFLIDNYRPQREKQNGETELKNREITRNINRKQKIQYLNYIIGKRHVEILLV